MSSIMNRKAAEFWWNIPIKGKPRKKFVVPKNVAYYETDDQSNWKETTWEEIFLQRKQKQNASIKYKRIHSKIKPAFIWVFYNDSWIMGGWYIYLKTLHEDYPLNFKIGPIQRKKYNSIIKKIMQFYPCGTLPFDFYYWAPYFAKEFNHVGFNRTIQGLVKCRCIIDKYNNIEDVLL